MLFDKGTKKITALLDFDFTYASNPFKEFTMRLGELGCNVTLAESDVVQHGESLGRFQHAPC